MENTVASAEVVAMVSIRPGAVVVREIRDQDAPAFAHLATGFGQGRLNGNRAGLVALGAYLGSEPAGLFLGALHNQPEQPRALSVLTLRVAERYRRQGVGTLLLAAGEEAARAANCEYLNALLASDSPEGPAAQILAARCGWMRFRMISNFYKIPWRLIESSHWATRIQPWPEHFEVFPWQNVTAEERESLLAKRDDPFQFTPGLDPFVGESQPTRNSVGLRIKGNIAGWAVSWHIRTDPPDLTTMSGTRLFVRGDLQRRGYGAMLLAEHIKRCPEAGIHFSVFSVAAENRLMLRLLNKHLRPYISHSREIWEMRKVLLSAEESARRAGA